ncbi:MAG: iron ABC transporter permease [Alcaligenaceae bacterium]
MNRAGERVWLTPKSLLLLGLLIVSTTVLVPCLMLVYESLTVLDKGVRHATLQNYANILSEYRSFELLGRTVLFSAVMTVCAGSCGFLFAWIAVRTNTPGRRLMPIAVLLPYLIPPTLGAVCWILLLSPRNGIINQLLSPIFADGLFNIYSFAGMVFVEALYTFPLAFIFFYASLSAIDPVLEEASAAAGAGPLQTFWKITLPRMLPTLISVATILFIIGLESFDVAWFLGYPAKIYILSIEVFLLTRFNYPSDIGGAAVYGVLALIAAAALVQLYRHVTADDRKFVAITGKGYRLGTLDIGRYRWVASVSFYSLITIIGIIPIFLLGAISLDAVTWPFSLSGTARFDNYKWIFSDSESLRAITNTAMIALGGATLAVTIGFVISYVCTRTDVKGRGALDYIAFLPFAFPGSVLAIGIIATLIDSPLYNTIWIMLLAFCIKFMPYSIRNINSSIMQVHREMEEASHVSGGTMLTTIRRIVLPLVIPGLIAAWSLLFIVFVRQFSLPIMLSSPGSQVLTIMLFQEWDAGKMGHVAAYGILMVSASLPFMVAARLLSRQKGAV